MSTHKLQTWGELLISVVVRRAGGMATLLDRLAPVIEESPWVGSKNPYDDLTKMVERPDPKSAEYVRAWFLAVVADDDVLAALGLADDGLPPLLSAPYLREKLGQPAPRRRK